MHHKATHNISQHKKMSYPMFCYQCEETQHGYGCTRIGTCGKREHLSARQDLLTYMVRGLAVVADILRQHNKKVDARTGGLIVESLFATMTNVNFDDLDIERRIIACMELRYEMMQMALLEEISLPEIDEVQWFGLPLDFAEKARKVSLSKEQDSETQGYKEFILYGLKGMASYLHHAMNLGHNDPAIHQFIQHTLARITLEYRIGSEWQPLLVKVGEYGLRTLALLDNAHVILLGSPAPREVTTRPRRRPGILVSGHDMSDLKQLLEQCEQSGIDVYTHGEMLPAHYYPELRKFHALAGHYGGSWWEQHREFEAFKGPVLITSNCLVPLYRNEEYQRRLFTTGAVAYPGSRHIFGDLTGKKDFSRIIDVARRCEAPEELSSATLTGGYAHHYLAQKLETLIRLYEEGKVKQFVVIAGCDGRMSYRQYYSDLAQKLPKETMILTAGCTKYRFLRENLDTIGSFPRVMDIGQCNDIYSIILFANMLRDNLKIRHLHEVPIVFHLAWYEQKSIIILLTLFYLGIHLRLGPTFPAFITPEMRLILHEKMNIHGITTADNDARDRNHI